MKIFQPTITGSFTVVTGSSVEFQVTNTGVKIGNTVSDVHTITGSLNISSSAGIVSASEIGYLSGSTTLITNIDDFAIIKGFQGLGSTIKCTNLGIPSPTQITNNVAPQNGSLRLAAVYVSKPQTVSGVRFWMQTVSTSYTASNYTGVALYSVSAGTLTCVVSSSNSPNMFSSSQATSTTWASQSFGTSVNINPGVYYVGSMAGFSSATPAPAWGTGTAVAGQSMWLADLTNSYKIVGYLLSQTSMPTSIAASSLLFTSVTNPFGLWLY